MGLFNVTVIEKAEGPLFLVAVQLEVPFGQLYKYVPSSWIFNDKLQLIAAKEFAQLDPIDVQPGCADVLDKQ